MFKRSKLYLRWRLGSAYVIQVDAGKVHFHVGTNEPATQRIRSRINRFGSSVPGLRTPAALVSRMVGQAEPWLVTARDYPVPERIENDPRHALLADFLVHRDQMRDSIWYAKLCTQLEQNGIARHKEIVMRSRDEIDTFFRKYVLDMIESLERTGYDPIQGGRPGTALIGADGELHKAESGNHRFCAARLLGVRGVPVAISGVHEEWIAAYVGQRMDIARLRKALAGIAENFA